MDGWDYPRHLKGRLLSIVVHGNTEGADTRRGLSYWLKSMELESAGALARYIGYWKKHAEDHADPDKHDGMQGEVRDAALTLKEEVLAKRARRMVAAGSDPVQPRQK